MIEFFVSKTNCILAWNHLFINERGQSAPCCFRTNSSSLNPISISQVQEIPNSKFMKSIREDMLNGIFPEQCKNCERIESIKETSPRTNSNKIHNAQLDKAFISSDFYKLKSIDIRVGNKCNLSCRMCFPGSSKNLIPEFRKITGNKKDFIIDENSSWYESEEFWKNLLLMINDVEVINLAGGEPFIIEKVLDFLEELISLGKSKNITLTFNTNLTVLPPRMLEAFKKFKGVELTVSIDGFEKVNDFIRYPSSWTTLDKNLTYIDEHFQELNIKAVYINTVVQIYNLFSLPDLFTYLNKFKHINNSPDLSLVKGAPWFDIAILPIELVNDARDKYNTFFQSSDDHVLKERVEYIFKHIETTKTKNSKGLIKEFRRVNDIFDNNRNSKVEDFIPELRNLAKTSQSEYFLRSLKNVARTIKKSLFN